MKKTLKAKAPAKRRALKQAKKPARPLPPLKTPEQEARAIAQREENRQAKLAGLPLPYPNPWDEWDPTKVDPGASEEEIRASYRAFRKICRPRPRKEYFL